MEHVWLTNNKTVKIQEMGPVQDVTFYKHSKKISNVFQMANRTHYNSP